MAFQKSPPELVERFSRLLPKHPDLIPKSMFGYPGSFVKGNFFVGLYEESIVVRVPPDQKAHLPQLNGAPGFNPMSKGDGMKDWYILPAEIVSSDEQLAHFLDAAFEQVLTLPEKVKKPKATKKPRKSS